jgi:hypothetical protein
MNCVKSNSLTAMTVQRDGIRAALFVTLTIPLFDEFLKCQNWNDKARARFRPAYKVTRKDTGYSLDRSSQLF